MKSLCPVCAMEVEDNYHPFVMCPLARDLYRAMSWVWSLPSQNEFLNTSREWLFQVLEPLDDVRRCMLLMTFWRVWYVRNELVHNKPAPPVEVSCRFLQSYLDSLIGIKLHANADPCKGKSVITYAKPSLPSIVPRDEARTGWSPPEHGWVKLNSDGSFVAVGDAGAGMILRDEAGSIIFAACRKLYSCRDALEAELCACMEGLSVAIQRSELLIIVEMDSSVAVSMVQSKEVDRSVYASIVKEIKYLRGLRLSCITHVPRSQNRASDCLASFARLENRTMTWLGSGPP